jgi:hypothetical protein
VFESKRPRRSFALWISTPQPTTTTTTTTRDDGELIHRLAGLTLELTTGGAQIQLISEAVSKPLIHRRIEALAAKLRRRYVLSHPYAVVGSSADTGDSRRRQLIGSHDVATEVVKLIREVVAGAKFDSFETLMGHILEVGKALQYAGPKGESITRR